MGGFTRNQPSRLQSFHLIGGPGSFPCQCRHRSASRASDRAAGRSTGFPDAKAPSQPDRSQSSGRPGARRYVRHPGAPRTSDTPDRDASPPALVMTIPPLRTWYIEDVAAFRMIRDLFFDRGGLSPATIDRDLALVRTDGSGDKRRRTAHSSAVRQSMPIRTYAD